MIIISYKTLIIIEKNDFDEKAPTLISKFLHEHEYSDKSAPLKYIYWVGKPVSFRMRI